MPRLIDVNGVLVEHYPYRQFVVEANDVDPAVPAGTNLVGVTLTVKDPATGEVLVARNGDTGDAVSMVTDDRGETMDLVYLPLPQVNVSAPGSKIYSVTTSDLGALVAELKAARQAAEEAGKQAEVSAGQAAQAVADVQAYIATGGGGGGTGDVTTAELDAVSLRVTAVADDLETTNTSLTALTVRAESFVDAVRKLSDGTWVRATGTERIFLIADDYPGVGFDYGDAGTSGVVVRKQP